jgi:hypothetical protein
MFLLFLSPSLLPWPKKYDRGGSGEFLRGRVALQGRRRKIATVWARTITLHGSGSGVVLRGNFRPPPVPAESFGIIRGESPITCNLPDLPWRGHRTFRTFTRHRWGICLRDFFLVQGT